MRLQREEQGIVPCQDSQLGFGSQEFQAEPRSHKRDKDLRDQRTEAYSRSAHRDWSESRYKQGSPGAHSLQSWHTL